MGIDSSTLGKRVDLQGGGLSKQAIKIYSLWQAHQPLAGLAFFIQLA